MPNALPSAVLHRRRWLGRALALSGASWLGLSGCATPWPEPVPGAGSSSALRHLQACAEAQGLAAWRGLQDLSLSLTGINWPSSDDLLGPPGPPRASPTLQLRLLPGASVLALAESTAGGHQLLRRQAVAGKRGEALALWADGRPVNDAATRRAAAQAADLHRLLLLGCLAVADHPGPVNWAEPQTLDGRRCDHLHLALRPGLGGAAQDRLSLFIDRDQGLLRRLRLSLGGPQADLIEVDLGGHRRLHGVAWPSRWSAQQTGALPGRATRRWQLAGLDVNRGIRDADLAQSPWAGTAAAPAAALPPG